MAAAKQLSVGAKRSMQQLEKQFHSAFCRIQDPFERDLWEIQQWRTGSHHGSFWSWEVDAHEHSGGIQVSRCQQRKLCEGRSHFRAVVPGSILSCTAFATGISAHMDSWEPEHMRACVSVSVGGMGGWVGVGMLSPELENQGGKSCREDSDKSLHLLMAAQAMKKRSQAGGQGFLVSFLVSSSLSMSSGQESVRRSQLEEQWSEDREQAGRHAGQLHKAW